MHKLLEELSADECDRYGTTAELKELLKDGLKPSDWKDCGSNELKVYYKLGKDNYAGFYVRGTIANRNFLSKHSKYD